MTTLTARLPGASSYLAVARLALLRRLEERLLLLSRTLFLGLLILIFSRLWRAVLPSDGHAGLSSVDCVWYIAVTEWVTLAQPRLFLEIERDVRSGELAYQLMRPTSYLLSKLSEALAELCLSLLVLGVAGFGFAYWLSGALPEQPRALLWALPLGLLAGVLNTLFSALIGVAAFWVVDCTPLAWVFQKLTFVLGGLMVPLAFYPEWLKRIALVTPFAALVHGPGQSALGASSAQALAMMAQLVLWIALVAVLLNELYQRGRRAIDLHGG